MIAAPLKQGALSYFQRLGSSFRDRVIAAPLKQASLKSEAMAHEAGFRDRVIAAPLKQAGQAALRSGRRVSAIA